MKEGGRLVNDGATHAGVGRRTHQDDDVWTSCPDLLRQRLKWCVVEISGQGIRASCCEDRDWLSIELASPLVLDQLRRVRGLVLGIWRLKRGTGAGSVQATRSLVSASQKTDHQDLLNKEAPSTSVLPLEPQDRSSEQARSGDARRSSSDEHVRDELEQRPRSGAHRPRRLQVD